MVEKNNDVVCESLSVEIRSYARCYADLPTDVAPWFQRWQLDDLSTMISNKLSTRARSSSF